MPTLILPAGDVRIGPKDYNIYTNSQLPTTEEINRLPLKIRRQCSELMVADIGQAKDAAAIQTNIVRVDGQQSVYLPILKQGGDSNTIAIVNGIKAAVSDLLDVPKSLVTKVVFDQSVYVKTAIENLGSEGGIGLVLTALMILIFLGNFRATVAVMLSIPLSALAAFLAINASGGSINTMVLGGLALAFSRLIDNSVVVLENIFRHLEMGETPEVGCRERRSRGRHACTGRDLHHRDRLFPGRVSLWCEPVSVHRSCRCGGLLPVCLLCRGHDRGAIILR